MAHSGIAATTVRRYVSASARTSANSFVVRAVTSSAKVRVSSRRLSVAAVPAGAAAATATMTAKMKKARDINGTCLRVKRRKASLACCSEGTNRGALPCAPVPGEGRAEGRPPTAATL
eukprot:scaffold167814_cov40-Tisochrysis_lutea.AAC.3